MPAGKQTDKYYRLEENAPADLRAAVAAREPNDYLRLTVLTNRTPTTQDRHELRLMAVKVEDESKPSLLSVEVRARFVRHLISHSLVRGVKLNG